MACMQLGRSSSASQQHPQSVADSILSLFNLDPGNDELEKDNISSQMMPIEESPASSELPQESPSTEEIVLEQQPGLKDLFPDQFTPALDLRDLAVKTTTFSDRTQQLESEIWALPEADGALVLSSKRSVSNFSDHLDYIFKLLGLSGISEHFSSAPLLIHSLLHCFIQQCWPVMDHWFQITDSCAVMKTVMWWQTTKSPQSFIDMLDGYSPTPVQLVLSYPCIIDWIPHPTIRNVMVTNYEMYDVDQVICDMTDAYVVENQHSVENTKPESCNVMEMVQRYPPSAEDARITQLYANLDTSRFHPRSQFLQTHHIQGFKIDPSFFVKYPGLYDATAIAKTSCSSIRIHERVEVKHRPLPFTAASASKYLDMVTQAKANAFQ